MRKTASLLLLGLVAVLAGCHYHLGMPQACLPFKRLYVKPVANRTYIPQAQALLSNQLRIALQEHGVNLVNCPDDADAILSVTLVEFTRTTATTKQDDTFLASSFNLTLTADCDLYNPQNGKHYFEDRLVTADINTFTQGSTQAVEYQDMPTLTRDMAREIKSLVVDTW